MTLAMVDSSSGAALGGLDEARRPSRRWPAGRGSRPQIPGTSWSANRKRVATPKLPPPPRMAQNRSGSVCCIHLADLAVSGHDLGGEERVDGQTELADEVADAAAQGEPARARPTRCLRIRPPGHARAAAVVKSAAVRPRPGPRRFVPRDRCRCASGRAGRSPPRPRSCQWPAPLWPPLRTASSKPAPARERARRGRRRPHPRRGRWRRGGCRSVAGDDGPQGVVVGIVGCDRPGPRESGWGLDEEWPRARRRDGRMRLVGKRSSWSGHGLR